MKYKYILFDVDGTIIDSSSGLTKSMSITLKDFGYDNPPEFYNKFIGPPFIQSSMKYLGMDEATARKITTVFRDVQLRPEYLFDVSIIDGALDTIHKLKTAGAHLFVCTCRPQIFIDRIMEHLNLTKEFEIVAGVSSDGTGRKIDAINTVRQAHPDVTNDKYVMIGDRDQDLEGACEAGIDGIGIRTGFADEGELEAFNPVFIANNHKELIEYLLSD